jgi:hypothetical protein
MLLATFQLSLVSTNARANPESGPKLPIVSLRLPTSRQKIDQGWSLEALNWDNYVAHVQFEGWRLTCPDETASANQAETGLSVQRSRGRMRKNRTEVGIRCLLLDCEIPLLLT